MPLGPQTIRWAKRIAWASGGLLGLAALACLGLRLVPLPPALFHPPPGQREFTDRNGTPLRIVRAEQAPFLQPAQLNEVPQAFIQATLAAEDKRFWNHAGVDWPASARAAWDWLRYGRIISGASTITQQLIKQVQPRPRTLPTKLREALQALRLEQLWDKQQILTEYLNRIDYGNFNTGCAAAARFYFGKPVAQLSPAECALLAGLPQAPARLNPLVHAGAARKRQQWILQRMRQCGFLTETEFARAGAEPLRLRPAPRAFEAPHFLDLLFAQLCDQPEPGLPSDRLRTSLDLPLNRFAEQCVRGQLRRLGPHRVSQAAVVVLDNRDGSVLALVGSADYFNADSGQVNGAWAPRSAGSTFKPFTYALALEQGATPATLVADVPTDFVTPTGLFSPVNYDHHCHGPTRYRLALANSLNIAAVKVLASAGGPAALQQRLQACGLTTLTNLPEHYGLGLTIGNAEARLLELANAYACLARLGDYRPIALLAAPMPPDKPPRSAARIFSAEACYLIADILNDNDARTPAFGAESNLRFDFPVACKTGTSSDFRDNWAFGYTPDFTVGVWAGNFDGSPMQNISGVTGAAPILHELFDYLHRRYGTSWYPCPTNVISLAINPVTGKRIGSKSVRAQGAIPGMESPVGEKFLASRLPPAETPEDYDSQGRIRLPADYRDWFAGSDNWLAGLAVLNHSAPALRIVFPLPGTTFYLDPDLPDSGRRIQLQAEGCRTCEWRSRTLECRPDAGQAYALLTPGEHQLRALDPSTGQEQETWVRVLQR